MHAERNRSETYVLLFISVFVTLMVGLFLRIFLKRYKLIISHAVLVLLVAIIVGLFKEQMKKHFPSVDDQYYLDQRIYYIFYYFFVPITYFKAAFFIDYQSFDKCISQILVISILVIPTSILIMGSVMRLIINRTGWPFTEGILFGSMCMAIYPKDVVKLIESSTYFTKHVIPLLEGEALVGLIVVINVFEMAGYSKLGYVVHWYQLLCVPIYRIIKAILIGGAWGLVGIRLMRVFYNDTTNILLITTAITFVSQHFSMTYGSSHFAVIVTAIIMAREKTYLSPEIIKPLTVIWKLLAFCVNVFLLMVIGIRISFYTIHILTFYDFCLVFLTYITDICARTISFHIFHPILSRIGVGMNYANRSICIWGGVKHSFNLGFTMMIPFFVQAEKTRHIFLMHSVMLFILSNLSHTFSKQWLNVLGVVKPPLVSKINMHNCMKYILETRGRFITLAKMNKRFSDVNWAIVENMTNIKNPYEQYNDPKDNIEDYIDLRMSTCPKCKTLVPCDPTEKEFNEMMRDTKLRILNSKKFLYRMLFEKELITKKVLRTLIHAVELAAETKEAVINTQFIFKLLNKEPFLEKYNRKKLQRLGLSYAKMHIPPHKPLQRICFNIVSHPYFEIFVLVVIFLDSVFLIIMDLNEETDGDFLYFEYPIWVKPVLSTIFCAIYLLEFFMKVLAYTKDSIFRDGICTYFKSVWNILDFLILLLTILSLITEYILVFNLSTILGNGFFSKTISTIILLRMTRFVKLLKFGTKIAVIVMKFVATKYDLVSIEAYDIGEAFTAVERTVIRLVQFMTDNQTIRDTLKKHLEEERANVVKLLITKRKERPDITIVGKSKQAVITVLNYMSKAMYELKCLGWLDEVEYENFVTLMLELYKNVVSIKPGGFSIPTPLMIFQEVRWLENNKKIADFLYQNIGVEKFDPGQVIVNSGDVLNGIYIVITGIFRMCYTPAKETIKQLHRFGALPIVDYMPTNRYSDNYWDYIVTGNCIGELALLVHRPYSCSIVSDAYSQVYFISEDVIKQAMAMDPNPISGLKCRIWNEVAIRIGSHTLSQVAQYSALRESKIAYALERAFVPNLTAYKIFVNIFNMIEDILVIEGTAVDFFTREVFYGPCYIPRTTQKLILTNSKMIDRTTNIKTRLLIIPHLGVDKDKIMEMQSKELKSKTSLSCGRT